MRKPAAVWRHWVPGRPAPPSALGTSSAVTRQWVTAIFCTGNTTECPSETKRPGRQRVTAARGGSGARAPRTVPAGLHTWWTNASQVPHGRHRRNRGARRKQCPPLRTDCLCVCPQTYVWKQEPALPSCPAARRPPQAGSSPRAPRWATLGTRLLPDSSITVIVIRLQPEPPPTRAGAASGDWLLKGDHQPLVWLPELGDQSLQVWEELLLNAFHGLQRHRGAPWSPYARGGLHPQTRHKRLSAGPRPPVTQPLGGKRVTMGRSSGRLAGPFGPSL